MTSSHPYCERLRQRFDEHYDDELGAFLASVIARHLSSCVRCRDEYDLLSRTIDAIREKEAPEVPARVLRRVIENLSGPPGGAAFPDELAGPDLVQGLETP